MNRADILQLIAMGLIIAVSVPYVIWLDRKPIRDRKRFRRELPKRIAEARRRTRQLFRESHRRMDRAAGKHDDFHLGGWDDW